MKLKKSTHVVVGLLVAVVMGAGGCKAKTASSSAPVQRTDQQSSEASSLPVWKPDEKLVGQLASPAKVEGYQVRPPKGYTLTLAPPREELKGFAWSGPLRDDKTAPQFIIVITPRGPSNLEQILDKFLESVKARRVNWTETKHESGKINGLSFVRKYWTGTEPSKQWKMRGFMYLALDGSNYIQISSQDVEPHHEQALKLAEAAAFTFQK